VKLKKTLTTLSSGQKNPKKPKNTQKTQKNPKKPTGLGFFKKTRVFSNPDLKAVLGIRIRMFLGLPDPDPLVRGTDPDPSVFS
jgi:hypothetical protein